MRMRVPPSPVTSGFMRAPGKLHRGLGATREQVLIAWSVRDADPQPLAVSPVGTQSEQASIPCPLPLLRTLQHQRHDGDWTTHRCHVPWSNVEGGCGTAVHADPGEGRQQPHPTPTQRTVRTSRFVHRHTHSHACPRAAATLSASRLRLRAYSWQDVAEVLTHAAVCTTRRRRWLHVARWRHDTRPTHSGGPSSPPPTYRRTQRTTLETYHPYGTADT